ncbi:MAG: M23 family metallopeptidase, partial [Gallionella sp.]
YKVVVKVGQVVRRGDKIAEVGSTGRSTGNHLHFEVRYKGSAQNPVRFLKNAAS